MRKEVANREINSIIELWRLQNLSLTSSPKVSGGFLGPTDRLLWDRCPGKGASHTLGCPHPAHTTQQPLPGPAPPGAGQLLCKLCPHAGSQCAF